MFDGLGVSMRGDREVADGCWCVCTTKGLYKIVQEIENVQNIQFSVSWVVPHTHNPSFPSSFTHTQISPAGGYLKVPGNELAGAGAEAQRAESPSLVRTARLLG